MINKEQHLGTMLEITEISINKKHNVIVHDIITQANMHTIICYDFENNSQLSYKVFVFEKDKLSIGNNHNKFVHFSDINKTCYCDIRVLISN